MPEAERRGKPRLHGAAGCAQIKRLAQPHHKVVALELGVHAIERRVRRHDAGFEHLREPMHLEHARTALRVTRQALLRHDVQRIARRAADGMLDRVVQFGFIGIVGVRGCVVLGDHGDVVRRHAELRQVAHQHGVLAALRSRERAESGSRDRRMRAIGERTHVAHDAGNRQSQAQGDVTAGEQHGAAALRFDESAATPVVRTGEEARGDALCRHLLGVCGGVHVAEAVDGFDADVIDGASDHEISLAEADLVEAFLDGDGCGGACGDRLDHRAVSAHIGLHDVRRHDVRQRFLQDVAGILAVEVTVDIQFPHGMHATEAGALCVGDLRGVHGLQQFRGAESCGEERIHGGDDVPQCDRVHVTDHRGGDAPAGGIEAVGELAAHGARHRGAARHEGAGTLEARDGPFARLIVPAGARMGGVSGDVFVGFLLACHRERHVVVKEDLGGFLVGAILVRHAHRLVERPDARTGDDLVAVTVGDVLFGNGLALGVHPARLGVVLP